LKQTTDFTHFFLSIHHQFGLNSYCARLNGLSPAPAKLSGWTRPLGKNFLIAMNAKVMVLMDSPMFHSSVSGTHICFGAPSNCHSLQVNTLFETSEDDVVRIARGLAVDLSCMYFRVAGVFVVTMRVVYAIVAFVVTLSAWINFG
jgi:hypothetical protein